MFWAPTLTTSTSRPRLMTWMPTPLIAFQLVTAMEDEFDLEIDEE